MGHLATQADITNLQADLINLRDDIMAAVGALGAKTDNAVRRIYNGMHGHAEGARLRVLQVSSRLKPYLGLMKLSFCPEALRKLSMAGLILTRPLSSMTSEDLVFGRSHRC